MRKPEILDEIPHPSDHPATSTSHDEPTSVTSIDHTTHYRLQMASPLVLHVVYMYSYRIVFGRTRVGHVRGNGLRPRREAQLNSSR
eukprot:scaffold4862_cov61-Phaeocystis_antarctica.AAC.3